MPVVIRLDETFLRDYPYLSAQSKALAERYAARQVIEDIDLESTGENLWSAVQDYQADSIPAAVSSDQPIDVIIESDQAAILNLAWETLYHPEYQFLALNPGFTLSRRLKHADNSSFPPLECGKLRILLFSTSPSDLSENGRLQVEEERGQVLEAVAPLETAGLIELFAPDDGRFETFKQYLAEFNPHLIYLSGHGHLDHDYLNNRPYGSFLFEDNLGHSLAVNESDLADAIQSQGKAVQAVVLSACESGKSDPRDLNNGLMQILSQRGVPHVVGMRESILDNAGLQFAEALLTALSQQHTMASALQQARRAITEDIIGYVSRKETSHPIRKAITQKQWCLPALLSHDIQQPLVNWDFEPVPQVFSQHKNIENGISFPQQFLGRRQELYRLQQPLLSGAFQYLLVTGAGGMGKTALGSKLMDTLQRHDFTVYAVSLREIAHWDSFVIELKQSLGKETVVAYEQQIQSITDEVQKVHKLLDLLLAAHQHKLGFFFDNLESVQDEASHEITHADIAVWVKAIQSHAGALRLIITSRWKVPGFDEYESAKHHVLESPVYSDFVAFARQQGLLSDLRETGLTREIHEALGGNFRAFEFFVKASVRISAKEKDEFLAALGEAKTDSQTDMALAKVLEQRSDQERELLTRLLAYPVAVPMEGVSVMALTVSPPLSKHEDYLANLVAVSLLEQVDNREFNKADYQVAPLLRDYLLEQRVAASADALRVGALYLYEDLLETRFQILPMVHGALSISGQDRLAQDLLLQSIRPNLEHNGMYEKLLYQYLLPSINKGITQKQKADTYINIGVCFHALCVYDNAIFYFEKSLQLQKNKNDQKAISVTLNHISQTYLKIGEQGKAFSYLEKSLNIKREISDETGESSVLNNLAQILIQQGHYDRAKTYLEKGATNI